MAGGAECTITACTREHVRNGAPLDFIKSARLLGSAARNEANVSINIDYICDLATVIVN